MREGDGDKDVLDDGKGGSLGRGTRNQLTQAVCLYVKMSCEMRY